MVKFYPTYKIFFGVFLVFSKSNLVWHLWQLTNYSSYNSCRLLSLHCTECKLFNIVWIQRHNLMNNVVHSQWDHRLLLWSIEWLTEVPMHVGRSIFTKAFITISDIVFCNKLIGIAIWTNTAENNLQFFVKRDGNTKTERLSTKLQNPIDKNEQNFLSPSYLSKGRGFNAYPLLF